MYGERHIDSRRAPRHHVILPYLLWHGLRGRGFRSLAFFTVTLQHKGQLFCCVGQKEEFTIIYSSKLYIHSVKKSIVKMVDIVELRKSDFWKKKIRKIVAYRDADKNGLISRKDFKIIVERFKNNAKSTPDKVELFSKNMLTFCDKVGLVDDSVEQSYEEFEIRWQDLILKDKTKHERLFNDMFVCLDINGDGVISLEEWKAHSWAIGGVPPEHAEDSFKAMDLNKDGKVTMDEFFAYHNEYFYSTENKLNSAILFGPL